MFQAFVSGTGETLIWFVVTLSICIAIEHVAVIERHSLRSRIPGFGFQIFGIIVGGLVAWSLQQVWKSFGLEHSVIVPLFRWLSPLPGGTWLYILAMLVITDFLMYWRHRAEHQWMWPIHAVHHSVTELHGANVIGHPLQAIPDFLIVSLPLSFIQIPGPSKPLAVGLLLSLLTMYVHSPIDFHFGPLRRLFVDNRFHRLHHSLEERHFEKNFAVCFSVWDSLFGTAYWPTKDEWPKVGVAEYPPPRTLPQFLLLPLCGRRQAVAREARPDVGREVPLPR